MGEKYKIAVGTVSVGERSKQLVNQALDSSRISSGKLVSEFEEKFARYHNIKEAVAVSSGTDANTIALAALYDFDAKEGDEVILPAHTFIASANSIIHARFKPVFVDVDPTTYNINPKLIEDKISDKTIAIMPVHIFGRPCEMDAIIDIAEDYDLFVIEDCAEAHGAEYKGKKVGTFGDMSAFSFYVAHIITTGEGGAVITNNKEYAEVLRSLRAHGRACTCKKCVLNISSAYCPTRFKYGENIDTRFFFERIGYSCKMNEMEAALGIEQIESLDEIIAKRRKNIKYLTKHLSQFSNYFQLPIEKSDEKISPLAYNIVIKKGVPFSRKELVDYLERNNIETRPMFGSIPDQQPAYSFVEQRGFENAKYIGENGFYIGVHQNLDKEDLEYITETLSNFITYYS